MPTNPDPLIYWALLANENWKIHAAATPEGLCYVGSQNKPFEDMAGWIKSRFPGLRLIQDDQQMKPYINELTEYLQGKQREFSIPFDFKGTPFQVAVWNALIEIPYGQTVSYSDIANHIRKPTAVRAVGAVAKRITDLGRDSMQQTLVQKGYVKSWTRQPQKKEASVQSDTSNERCQASVSLLQIM